MTIEEFIEARINDDEQIARAADHTRWLPEDKGVTFEYADIESDYSGRVTADTKANMNHIARHAPARVLQQAAMARAILRLHRSEETMDKPPYLVCRHDQVAQMSGLYPCSTVRYLAAIWANHPDYRQEWESQRA